MAEMKIIKEERKSPRKLIMRRIIKEEIKEGARGRKAESVFKKIQKQPRTLFLMADSCELNSNQLPSSPLSPPPGEHPQQAEHRERR